MPLVVSEEWVRDYCKRTGQKVPAELEKNAARRSKYGNEKVTMDGETLDNKLNAITDDIADLQYERLSQAHDFYTTQGWCPTSKKEQLCTMYKSYHGKGRNHLSAHYEKDILSLADKPRTAITIQQ